MREGFLALARAEPERFRVIDSAGGTEATEAQVRAALASLLPALAAERAVNLSLRRDLAGAARGDGSTRRSSSTAATPRARAARPRSTLARTLLCEAEPAARPCGVCRHCRRIVWPEPEEARAATASTPTSRSWSATSRPRPRSRRRASFLRTAQVSPFEARGQVFVVASAETLTGEAANALLKNLEEPHDSAPRHFLLLAPSRLDLLPTLRSRSLVALPGADRGASTRRPPAPRAAPSPTAWPGSPKPGPRSTCWPPPTP